MSWVMVFTVLWEFLKPLLSELLKRLLDNLVKNRPDFNEAHAHEEIEKFFDDADKKLKAWQVGQRIKLRMAKRAALKRVPEIVAACKAQAALLNIPPLTAEELAFAGIADEVSQDETAPMDGEQPE